jgi:acyl-CoA thioester hydrolase
MTSFLEIHTYVKKSGVKIEFDYEIYNEDKIKITEASNHTFFLDAETNKIVRCPDFLLRLIEKNWKI